MSNKITNLRHGDMTRAEMLQLLSLLAKAGYAVKMGRERPPGKDSGAWIHYVEYWDGNAN